jgi:capsular polysaccharide biosynthesis protein
MAGDHIVIAFIVGGVGSGIIWVLENIDKRLKRIADALERHGNPNAR